MSAILLGLVKGRHEEMKVSRQSLHHGNLGFLSANNGGHHLGRSGVDVEPCRQRGVFQRLEMPLDTLRRPGGQILLYPLGGALRLQTERVAAEVGAFLLTGL